MALFTCGNPCTAEAASQKGEAEAREAAAAPELLELVEHATYGSPRYNYSPEVSRESRSG